MLSVAFLASCTKEEVTTEDAAAVVETPVVEVMEGTEEMAEKVMEEAAEAVEAAENMVEEAAEMTEKVMEEAAEAVEGTEEMVK